MKFKKKSIWVLVGVLAVATALLAYGPGMGAHGRGYENYDNPLSEEFYEQHSSLLEKNQEKTEDIFDEIEDNHEAIEDEVEKKNPNWDKVSKLMDKQHELRADLMELGKQEKLQLLKDADYEQRQELFGYGTPHGYFGNCAGGNYRRGFRGRMGRGYHHYNNDDYQRNTPGRGRGHMMGR